MDSTNGTARVLKVTSRANVDFGPGRRAMRWPSGPSIVALVGLMGGLGPAVAGGVGAGQAWAASTPTSYVTNSQSDTVTVVSGTAIARTIRVGQGPVGIALTPDRTVAYVANYGFSNEPSHTVTPITLATGKAGRPITVGTGPMAIAVDSQVAVVTLEGTPAQPGHQVVVIDLASRKVSAPIEVGLNPESVAIAPDGQTAYVAAFGSAEVTPVNLSTSPPQAESPIPLPGTSPRAIAISKDGTTAYVLDTTKVHRDSDQPGEQKRGPGRFADLRQDGRPRLYPDSHHHRPERQEGLRRRGRLRRCPGTLTPFPPRCASPSGRWLS